MSSLSQLFTGNRGNLAKIWLAAHWERKLTKASVYECDLETSVTDIIKTKANAGLRASSHLLIGAVRIYCKKTKYLLADCNDVITKFTSGFRPILDQTDLPENEIEATMKAITLKDDFVGFESQLPDPSQIDVTDHFSLNQSRLEEITMKDDHRDVIRGMSGITDLSLGHSVPLLDASFRCLPGRDDSFGDEGRECDTFEILTNPNNAIHSIDYLLEKPFFQTTSAEKASPAVAVDHGEEMVSDEQEHFLNDTTLISDEKAGFALEPVTSTPDMKRKMVKRRRELVVDQPKELSVRELKQGLSDYSDLVVTLAYMEFAPPTVVAMQWKEDTCTRKLFSRNASGISHHIFNCIFQKNIDDNESHQDDEKEAMRHESLGAEKDSSLHMDINGMNESFCSERTHSELGMMEDGNISFERFTEIEQNESELTHPSLPSEDSMFVHPSHPIPDTQSTIANTQSMLNTQDYQERRTTKRAFKLLEILKFQKNKESFGLKVLCQGCHRAKAASTVMSLLILKKQQLISLHQSGSYEEVIITTGPLFPF